ncbi:glycoside hydrolase family 11 protein [Xylariaceae sp. FL0255]|nr:glycoside hydrolase family 11 protein [Xylariaceae sp. FL0255]
MVAFTNLIVALSTVVGAFAAPTPDPDLPDFEIGPHNLARRQDYTQNYKTGGNVDFSSTSNGYSVTLWGFHFVLCLLHLMSEVVLSISYRNITFSGTTSASAGTVLVLVEYYIQEYSNGQGAAQGTQKGTLESDGSTYEIWEHQQVNQPSIQGTSTFNQYISVRQTPRPSGGQVTVANHFAAWAALGMNLGTINYQTISTEGWGNAGGSSQFTISESN